MRIFSRGKPKRLVVKIGSRSLADAQLTFDAIAKQIADLRARGVEVVLVSSGAIALGRALLRLSERPKEIDALQACAAVGQSLLMQSWSRAFAAHSVTVAQVLLTHADLSDRERHNNARAALRSLLKFGVVPVINENDTVAVDEIRFGDNDQLASMVVTLVDAELLVLLTDVEGLLDHDGKVVSSVPSVSAVSDLIKQTSTSVGTGGMRSKLDAAERATERGVDVVIAKAGLPHVLSSIVSGGDIGTLVPAVSDPLSSRKHWIAFTLRPHGVISVDLGAVNALMKGASLLAAGVRGVRGDFSEGDAVSVEGPDGREIGRGLVRMSVGRVASEAGPKHRAGESAEVIHRDDLVCFRGSATNP